MADLTGKVALITGSGRGLGYAMATRLAELGANVALHDRSTEAPAEFGEHLSLQDAAEKLTKLGVRTTYVIADIAIESEVKSAVALVESQLGPIDILVNCAGGDIAAKGGKPNPNDALHIKMEDVQALINRNFIGTLLMCQAVVPGMLDRKRGAVVNIASSAAHIGVSPEVVYSSIKAAIVHFSRCLSVETRPHGVRVNVVSPGPTMSARFLNTRTTDPEKTTIGTTLNRYAQPTEIADVVAYLAGDQASFVHGQVIRVDGGGSVFAG